LKTISHISTAILTVILLLSAICCHAAQWQGSGLVVDNSGEPLAGVVVKLIGPGGSTLAFSSTDGKGRFRLSTATAPAKGSVVRIAYLGFSTKEIPATELRDDMKITLEEAPLELKEVVVKVPPIKMTGDTLTYDVASFRGAADRTIEDVIKKLPGVEVNDKGTIYYNGEAINRFYIEGLDVVSGRYAIATKNISPDDIISVNVYENHQPKRVLKDIAFSDRAAINLKMKKKSMLKPVGHVTGGGGVDDDGEAKWLGELFSMFVAPKMQVLVTGKGNNWGKSYTIETGNLISEFTAKSSAASNLYGDTPFGTAKIPAERYFDNTSASASVNTVRKLGEFGKLGITADYTDEDNRTVNSESISYNNGSDPDIGFNETVRSRPHSREAKLNINVEHNAPRRYISDKFTFKGHFADNRYSIFNTRDISQHSRTDDYAFTNTLDATIRTGNRVLSVKSDIAVTTTPTADLSATDAGSTMLRQKGSALSFTTDEKTGYSWMLGEYSHIGANLRFESVYDRFRSTYITETAGNASNNVSGYTLKTTIEPEYQFKPGTRFSLKVQIPVSYSAMDYDNRLTSASYPAHRVDAGARIGIHGVLPLNIKASLTLGRQVTLGGIKDFILNPVYTTYRQRTTLGSGLLNEREGYSAMTNVFYKNPIHAVFITFTGLYRIGHNNRISGSTVTPGEVSTTVENSGNKSDMLNLGLNIAKNVRAWRTTFTLDTHLERLKRKVLRQKLPYTVENTSYTIHAAIRSNPVANVLEFSAEGWYRPSVQKIKSLGVRNSVNDMEGRFSASVHPIKSVELYTQLYWNHTSLASDVAKESFFIGAGIRCHIKRFDIELSSKNLTNCRTYTYSYFTDADLYTYTFNLRPIEFLATVKYTF